MGLGKFFKKHFFEDVEEYNIDDLNDLIEDSEEYETVKFKKKRTKSVKQTVKKPSVQEERNNLREEEAKYDQLLNNVRAEEVNRALNITEKEVRLHSLEKVDIGSFNSDDVNNYVISQCEIMEEALKHIDRAMEQYTDVAEHFSDIEKIEAAPENLRKQITLEAERVDNLTVDRRIFRASESKLSNSTYRIMEQYETEIPKVIGFIESQENYFDNVKQDMRAVEGEQMALRIEARALKKRQINIKHAAVASLVCLMIVFSIFVIAIVATGDESNMVLFIMVTILSAILAVGMYAILKSTQRAVYSTEVRLNKTTSMLNKIKIRYVNTSNVLAYEYEKYKITNAYELSRKYQTYLEMKQEQKNVMEMTAKLSQAEERLMSLLRQTGVMDANIWAGQVRALYNHSEMVEIRHEYAVQRQKLREQVEYNQDRIDDAKKNIKLVTKKYPNYTGKVLEIIDKYEKRGRQEF